MQRGSGVTLTLRIGAWLIALGALVLAAVRVVDRERSELDYEGEPQSLAQRAAAPGSTAISARLATVALRRGDDVL